MAKPPTKAPTTAEVADRRAVLLEELEAARIDLARIRVRAAEAHLARARIPDELTHQLAVVAELDETLEGYNAVAAAAEFRELGQRIGLDEAEIGKLESTIPELDQASLEAAKAEPPIIDGKVDYEAHDTRAMEAHHELRVAAQRLDKLRDGVERMRSRRAELQNTFGQLLDGLWVASRRLDPN